MSTQLQQALQWVENAKDGATKEALVNDFEPIGDYLYQEMQMKDLVWIDPVKQILTLTKTGKKLLEVV